MLIDKYLMKARMSKSSDVHITVGRPPMMRLNGTIVPIMEGEAPYTPEQTAAMCVEIIPARLRQEFEELGEVDFAYQVEGYGRFRVNIFHQKGRVSGVLRLLNDKIASFEELGLPRQLKKFTTLKKGLVLITGPTGSGKSTTLATIIDAINKTRYEHIITLEDPIEYVHEHNYSLVNQREVGQDTMSFANGLRASLREDPDVILVGEMRDPETIAAAVTAAETGHLVFSTLHTIGASTTINRIIDVFEPHQQGQVRTQLASVIEGVVTQRLVPNTTNTGRIAAFEIMFGSDGIRNMIRENKAYQIPSVLQTSAAQGMITLDAYLARLVMDGRITRETAFTNCLDRDNLNKILNPV
jgi:twitching motility protein PilT